MGGGGSDNQVTRTEPPTVQLPYLEDLFRRAQGRVQAAGPNYFPGPTVAPLTPEQQQAQQYVTGTAVPQAQQLANSLAGSSNMILSGQVLDPNTNPYLQATIDAAVRPIYENLTEQVLPAIGGGAVGARGVGGSRQGIAEGLATREASRAAGDTAASIATQGYNQGLQALTQNIALAPQTLTAGISAPGTLLDIVGTQNRQLAQEEIDAAVAKHNFEQTLPDQKLAQYAQLVSGNFGGTTTAEGGGTSATRTAVGMAATGASIGAAFSGVGAGVGAAAGLLMGLMMS